MVTNFAAKGELAT